jgi:hypothetical protein
MKTIMRLQMIDHVGFQVVERHLLSADFAAELKTFELMLEMVDFKVHLRGKPGFANVALLVFSSQDVISCPDVVTTV